MQAGGIYRITNSVNGKFYIGSAIHLQKRWGEHKKRARAGTHRNQFFQASWNKHGEAVFVFEVLRHCAPAELIAFEQIEIEAGVDRAGWDQMYNICRVAGSRLGVPISAETRRKIGDAQRGRPSNRKGTATSPEARARMRAAHANMSAETRAKMAAAKIGRKRPPFTDETRRRMAEAARIREQQKRTRKVQNGS